MPALFNMTDEKKTAEGPTVVIAETTEATKRAKTKKYAIIAVSAVLAIAIVLTAILVGMYFFTQAQKEIVQYTLQFGQNAKQEVTSDPNTNIVQFHVSIKGHDAWVVNDFNKDIQLVKIQTDRSTVCYLSALNRSNAMNPTTAADPSSQTYDPQASSQSLVYVTSNSPISDSSFLAKAARDMCSGISIYWAYPQCTNGAVGAPNGTSPSSRQRRDRVDKSPYYIYWSVTQNGNTYYCVEGCCRTVCACNIDYHYSYSNGQMSCTWYTSGCAAYPQSVISDQCANGPSGLKCPNGASPPSPPTC